MVALLYALPCRLSAQYESKELRKGTKRVPHIVILPPEANIRRSGMKGSEALVAESQSFGAALAPVVSEVLSEKGCTILQNAFDPTVLDRNPEFKYALADLQTRYDKLQLLMRKRPSDVAKARFSLGDQTANFSPGAMADGLVFVRADGHVPTTGLKTFVILTGMGVTYSHVQLYVSIVDAQTGVVLYFAKGGSSGNFSGNPEKMRIAIFNSFSGLRRQYPP